MIVRKQLFWRVPMFLGLAPRAQLPRFLFSKDYMSTLLHKLRLLQESNGTPIKSQVVIQQKNDCVYIRDTENEFSYLQEVETQEGSKGVVMDIRDKFVGIALYRTPEKVKAVSPRQAPAALFDREEWKVRHIYDVEARALVGAEGVGEEGVLKIQRIDKEPKKAYKYSGSKDKKRQIPILNPLLKVTQDINFGDFLVFQGVYGTGKTSTAMEVAQYFCKDVGSPIVLYLNFNLKDCQKLLKQLPSSNWFAFSETDKERSDAGGLLLALKTVNLAKRLREEGYNVLVVLENMTEILRREVSMLKNFHQTVGAFSVINELYCWTGVPSPTGGNITTIITLDEENTKGRNKVDTGDMAPTPYVNSLNHLHSLAVPIKFPLELRISQNPRLLSRCVNRLLQEQKDYELKSKLKVNTEPWENYFRLDSKWWVNSLKRYRAQDPEELELFLRFIEWNIETERPPHWTIPAHQAFKLLKQWVKDRQITFLSYELQNSTQVLQAFIMHCKMEGVYLPFGKDYVN